MGFLALIGFPWKQLFSEVKSQPWHFSTFMVQEVLHKNPGDNAFPPAESTLRKSCCLRGRMLDLQSARILCLAPVPMAAILHLVLTLFFSRSVHKFSEIGDSWPSRLSVFLILILFAHFILFLWNGCKSWFLLGCHFHPQAKVHWVIFAISHPPTAAYWTSEQTSPGRQVTYEDQVEGLQCKENDLWIPTRCIGVSASSRVLLHSARSGRKYGPV